MPGPTITNKKEFARMVAKEVLLLLEKQGKEVEQVLHPERFLSVRSAAKYLGVSESFVYHHKDEIPHSNASRKLVFTREGLDAYVERHGYR